MPAYVYRVRRREPRGGEMAVLPPDPPVVAAVEPDLAPVESPAEIIPVAGTASVEVVTTPKPKAPRKPRAKKS